MPALTSDQIKSLAPDPASLKAGQGLADARHWTSLGSNQAALWGECKGSGKEPYKVRVDLANNGSACTCPSRKFPCKHALGLMLLSAGGKIKESTLPAWVTEWLEKRGEKKEKSKEKKADSQADQEARQKDAARRAVRREKLAEAGVETLDLWLKDLVRQGLAFAQSAPPAFWSEQSARLVDAQLPGAARLVRELAALPGSRPDWAEATLLALGRLHLLVQAYRKLDTLPAASQSDVRSLLGWTVDQDELLATTSGVIDDWLVVAQTIDEDEKTGLRTQVNWLWGKTGHKAAQIINFAFRTQPLDTSLIPGLTLHGELVYFPGAYLLRAVFKNKQVIDYPFLPTGFPNFSSFLDAYAVALGLNPWLDVFPMVIEKVVTEKIETSWCLYDSHNTALPLSTRFSSPWELLALSGGHPLTIFGLWDGFAFMPMGVWEDGRFVVVSNKSGQ